MNVGIVVLSQNGWSITSQFLDSLYENTDIEDFELYFIDNGSTDGTPSKLEAYAAGVPNMTVVRNKKDEGVIGGRNQGFDWFLKASNKNLEYLVFLDNDQFAKDGWLADHMRFIESGCDLVGVEAWQLSRSFIPIQHNNLKSQWYSYVGCGGMIMKRAVAQQLGGFDEIFNPSYFEDPDYCFRCLDAGFKVGWNYSAKIIHLPHQTLGKATNKQSRFSRSLLRFQKKWKSRLPPMLYQKDLEK